MEIQDKQNPAHHVGRLINQLSHQLKRQMYVEDGEDSLTTNMQRLVLHHILLKSICGPVYQKDVEKEFQIRRSTATGILNTLEKNGFIIREPVKEDARLKQLVPTDKARSIRGKILENIRYMETLLQNDILHEDLDVCQRVLEQMSANLSGDEEKKRGENRP